MTGSKDRLLTLVSELKDELTCIDSIADSLSILPGKIKKAAEEDRVYLVESAGLELHLS